jgi:hypothetical protein
VGSSSSDLISGDADMDFPLFLSISLQSEGSVGKTSLVTRYVQNTFNERHVTTIQASFLTKRLNVDGTRVNISIWVRPL